jgi:hypothetical protein
MSFGGRGASSLLASGLTALLALGILAAPATAAKAPRVGGCYVFPAFKGSPTAASAASQTAWNQDVSKAPVDPRSGAYIRRITRLGGNQVVHPDFGGDGRYGIPYNVVGRHQRRVRVHVTAYPGESDFGRAPIPPHARVEGGSDRHVLVVQAAAATCSRCSAPTTSGPRESLERGFDGEIRPALDQAAALRLDLRRRRGTGDPASSGTAR